MDKNVTSCICVLSFVAPQSFRYIDDFINEPELEFAY